ncbi:MAG: hypothetical protein ACYDEV_15075 [Acidiferrobacter sp.]
MTIRTRTKRTKYPEDRRMPVWCLKGIDAFWAVDYFKVGSWATLGVVHNMSHFRQHAGTYINRVGCVWITALFLTLMAHHVGSSGDTLASGALWLITTVLFAATAMKTITVIRTPLKPDPPKARH